MSLPTKTQPMREAIILALAKLHNKNGAEDGFLSVEIQFWIAEIHAPDSWGAANGFEMTSPAGKAYERAMAQLQEEGIVVMHPADPNEIERVLAIFAPEGVAAETRGKPSE